MLFSYIVDIKIQTLNVIKDARSVSLYTYNQSQILQNVKDARSVSLYPYNRSQILQYVKYTK